MRRGASWIFLLPLASCLGVWPAGAQIDPQKRQLVQLGYNLPLEGHGPLAAYAYLYWNQPDFWRTNYALRLAIAPVYLDSELGIRKWLGEHTDLAFGIAGGGFADSFNEVRQGDYIRAESFTGHSGEGSVSLYHLFNPTQTVPLNLIVRAIGHYSAYERDDETDPNFQLPENRTTFTVRTGLRWGGRAPLIYPKVALELSVWYEAQFRNDYGFYGFNNDRELLKESHLFWSRGLFVYTLPKYDHHFTFSVTAGTSVDADRFSAYRLGAILPMVSEFPLTLPGYYFQELTADRFVLFSGQYLLPLDSKKRWNLAAFVGSAWVDYLPGFEQPGNWNSGAGGGITYRAPSGIWQIMIGYAHGFDAIRNGGRGANTIGIALQFDLEGQKARGPLFDPSIILDRLRGLERILRQ